MRTSNMKDRKFFIFLILLFSVSLAFGQENKAERVWASVLKQYNVVTVDLVAGRLISNRVLRVAYERTVHKKFSVLAYFERGKLIDGGTVTSGVQSGQVYGKTTEIQSYTIKGTGITFGARYYPFKRITAPAGLFVGSFFRYYFLRETYIDKVRPLNASVFQSTDIATSGHALNAGIVTGYKFILGPFVIEPLAGIATSSVFWKAPNQRSRIGYFPREKYPLGSIRAELHVGFIFPGFKKE